MKHVIFMMIYKCLLGKMTIIFVKPECLQGILGGRRGSLTVLRPFWGGEIHFSRDLLRWIQTPLL